MPFRFTDFGLGLDDDARRQAMRQALVDAGLTIMGRAGTEGFGSFGAGGQAFIGGYRSHLQEADERRRREREEEAEEEYRQERLESLRQAREERLQRGEERELSKAERERELGARRQAIEAIEDDKVRGELELRIAQPNFWEVLDKRTAPKAAPVTRDFPDGTERQWDPVAGDWKVIARKPPKESKGEDGGDERGFGAAGEILGRSNAAFSEARKSALARADKEIAAILKANAEKTAPPVPVPDRFNLAKKYEREELEASRYRRSLPPPGAAPPPAAPPPTAPPPAAPPPTAPPGDKGTSNPENAARLARAIEARVAELGVPPAVAKMKKAQILGRVRQLLATGNYTEEQILAELE